MGTDLRGDIRYHQFIVHSHKIVHPIYFPSRADADQAVDSLRASGFDPKNLSVVVRDEKLKTTGDNVAEGAASGLAAGTVIGGLTGLLVGLGALTIPGIGALFIAGPLTAALGLTGVAATTASGALTGAVAGGLVGALVGLGIPEEDARAYEARIKAGGVLLAVPTSDQDTSVVKTIFTNHNGESIREVAMK